MLTAAPAMADTYAQASVPGCWAQVDRSGVKARIILGSSGSDACTGLFHDGSTSGSYGVAQNQTYYGPWIQAAGNPLASVTVCNNNYGRCANSAWI
ncbi:hypothetical protein [Streptacidiphilus neutrinimicus]|uniref:hypothetical protein n=1 Tax=Streptacidiphilus neutrinimicus TaxID=105420 RepID=UPI001377A915|nr:hypothetical protein [Streptacidiphilus neutrinimicus]